MKDAQNAAVCIRLFGNFSVSRGRAVVSDEAWHTEANNMLFKVLASGPGRLFSQDELIEILWPKGDPKRAAASLRRRIAELRRILEPDLKSGRQSHYVQTRRGGYSFNPRSDCWIDVVAFSQHIVKGKAREERGAHGEAQQAYEAALALCTGEYLSEDRYAEWALDRRDAHWRGQHLDLLERLAECCARGGQYRRAIRHCRALLRQHPYHEQAYRQLMLYYHLSGFNAEVEQAYRQCRHALKEVEAEPASETRALLESIRQGGVRGVKQK